MRCRLRCSGPKIRNIGALGPLGLIMVWALGNDSLTSTEGLFKESIPYLNKELGAQKWRNRIGHHFILFLFASSLNPKR